MRARLVALFRDFDFNVAGKWLALGTAVGVVGGVGALAFQVMLEGIRNFCLTGLAGMDLPGPDGEGAVLDIEPGTLIPWLVVLLPAVGGLLSGLIVFMLAPEAEGHGTDAAIDSYHRKLGRIRYRVPLVKMVASAITIGTGGSGGREGPIAQIGAGFGSFLADRLHLSATDRRFLLAAGIGAGVGSIFRAPIAGAIFAGEVLYSSSDVETEVLLPATVSSIVAYSVYASQFGWGHMFGGAGGFGFSNPLELGPYLLLALLLALAALAYVRVFYGLRALFQKVRMPRPLVPALGGLLTGLIGLAFITVAGSTVNAGDVMSSGYGIIQHIIHTDGAGLSVILLLAVGFGKIITTGLSIGSGGSGGVFGPSMVIGATLGGAVGKLFHNAMPGVVQHPATFAIVGMAGFFAAAANTPISTVIMVSELTGHYELLVPSMWVCALAFLVSRKWTIYRSQVASRLWSPAHFGEFAPEILASVTVADVFHKGRKFVSLNETMSLNEVLAATSESRQRIFPVVDRAGLLLGAFRIEDLTSAARAGEPRSITAAGLMCKVPFVVSVSDTVERAQRLLRLNSIDEALVVDDDAGGKVLGILTSADILLAYTRRLNQDQAA